MLRLPAAAGAGRPEELHRYVWRTTNSLQQPSASVLNWMKYKGASAVLIALLRMISGSGTLLVDIGNDVSDQRACLLQGHQERCREVVLESLGYATERLLLELADHLRTLGGLYRHRIILHDIPCNKMQCN